MNYFAHNLYAANLGPINTDLKFIIYTQHYKNTSIPIEIKQDIQTLGLIAQVTRFYRHRYQDPDDTFLYELYNDLVHEHYINDEPSHRNAGRLVNNVHRLMNNDLNNRFIMQTFHNITRAVYSPFIIRRIRYFWRLLSPKQRVSFLLTRCVKTIT